MARGTRERYACHFKNRGTNSYNYNVTLTLDNQKYNNIFTLIHLICYLPWRDVINNFHIKTSFKLEKKGHYSSHHNLCESNTEYAHNVHVHGQKT